MVKIKSFQTKTFVWKKTMLMNILLIWVGLLIGVFIYVLAVRQIAIDTCLINSDYCTRIEYQKKNNTALIHDMGSGNYIWFVGDDVLLYNEPTGRVCDAPNESAYVWDLVTNKPRGYLCVEPLSQVKAKYYSKVPVQNIILKTRGTFELLDMVNALIDNKVIEIPAKVNSI